MFSKRKGFTLVEIMIVVAIIALLAAIAIPNLLRSRLNAAETNARAILRTLSSASESYAAANGAYPTAMTDLTDGSVPYVHEDYVAESPHQSYNIGADLVIEGSTYRFTAEPTGAFADGGRAFAVCTGGVTPDPTEPVATGATAPGCP